MHKRFGRTWCGVGAAVALLTVVVTLVSAVPPAAAAELPAGDAPARPAADQPAAAPQTASAGSTTPQAPPADAAEDEDDLSVDPVTPDFTLASLPTTVRLPRHKLAFRVTHRFTRPLGQGSFGDSASDLFGIDSGARIGLELRYAPVRRAQVGFYRTNEKTIEFFGQYDLVPQSSRSPLAINPVVTVEGTNNFRDSYSPAVGVIVSRTLGPAGAVYAQPLWVSNTNPLPSALVDHNDTFLLGLGTRLRVRPSVYVVAEVAPRLAGFRPNTTHASFGVEKRVGGHMFQLNFSNGFGTTPADIARGAFNHSDWYLGFNISRKFY